MTLARGLGLGLLVGQMGCVVAVDDGFCVREPVKAVVLAIDNGDVSVSAAEDLCVEVELGGVGSNGVGHEVDDDVLWLDYDCAGLCGGDIELTLPPGVHLDVQLGAGDLSLDGLSGDVSARVGAGELSGYDLVSSRVEALVAAGDLNLELNERPVWVSAVVSTGSLQVEVPQGAYALDIDAQGGSVSIVDITDNPEADAAIEARTGAGSLEIVGR